jgi:hypothetical protein
MYRSGAEHTLSEWSSSAKFSKDEVNLEEGCQGARRDHKTTISQFSGGCAASAPPARNVGPDASGMPCRRTRIRTASESLTKPKTGWKTLKLFSAASTGGSRAMRRFVRVLNTRIRWHQTWRMVVQSKPRVLMLGGVAVMMGYMTSISAFQVAYFSAGVDSKSSS